MTRNDKIESIITEMEKLNNLWWDAEENKNQAALEEHNALEQEIRAEMTEIGINFDTIGAEYEDIINKLRRIIEEEKKMTIKTQHTFSIGDATLEEIKNMMPKGIRNHIQFEWNIEGGMILKEMGDGRFLDRETQTEYE